MPCNCNVRVRATPPSAQAESQTVVQRLRQQAGRSRQAARQAAPACSRPFELVGTLTARFPLTCRDGARPTGGRKQGCERCRIPQKRTKENAVASIASIPKENAVGAPDITPPEGGRWFDVEVERREVRRSGEHAGLIVWQGSACLRKVGGTNPKRQTNPKCLTARLSEMCSEIDFASH